MHVQYYALRVPASSVAADTARTQPSLWGRGTPPGKFASARGHVAASAAAWAGPRQRVMLVAMIAIPSWSAWVQPHTAARSLARSAAASSRTPLPLLQVLEPPDDDDDDDDAPPEKSAEEMDAFRASLMRQMGGGQFGGGSADVGADEDEGDDEGDDDAAEPVELAEGRGVNVEDDRARLASLFSGGATAEPEASSDVGKARESGVPAKGRVLVANPQRFCSRNPFARAVKDLNRFGLQGPVQGGDLSADTKAQMLPVPQPAPGPHSATCRHPPPPTLLRPPSSAHPPPPTLLLPPSTAHPPPPALLWRSRCCSSSSTATRAARVYCSRGGPVPASSTPPPPRLLLHASSSTPPPPRRPPPRLLLHASSSTPPPPRLLLHAASSTPPPPRLLLHASSSTPPPPRRLLLHA